MDYVTYRRDESGLVERAHHRVALKAAQRAALYPHRESLRGWPERVVYWSQPTGRALGVAPLR